MPKIRPGMPKPPKGFDKINSALDEYDAEMKSALAEPTDGKRKAEFHHAISRVNSARTRYVFTSFKSGEIGRKVLDYCIAQTFIDGSLVRLWSVPGYETACCAGCCDSRSSTHGGTCVCRVPLKDRVSAPGPCSRCGCTGCASADVAQQTKEKRAAAATAVVVEEKKDDKKEGDE